jgi:uncharacterized OsmC-like protein
LKGYAEDATTVVTAGARTFIVDEPPRLWGKDLGPNPLNYFMASLVGCTQYTMALVARELKLPSLGRVAWTAAGEVGLGCFWASAFERVYNRLFLKGYPDVWLLQSLPCLYSSIDFNLFLSNRFSHLILSSIVSVHCLQYNLAGVNGTDPGVDARFQKIMLRGVIDGEASPHDLARLTELVERRCIVAATCRASGADVKLALERGEVDADSPQARWLRDVEAAAGEDKQQRGEEREKPEENQEDQEGSNSATGLSSAATAAGGPPKVRAGTFGRGYHTFGRRYQYQYQYHTSPAIHAAETENETKDQPKNGEEIAREHLHAELEPQLQKERSEQGCPEARGGAYASRECVKFECAQILQFCPLCLVLLF